MLRITELERVFVRKMTETPTWPLEVYLASQALLLGLWLLAPWSTFSALPGAYGRLGAMLPEPAWGAILFGHGVAHFGVLLNALVNRQVDPCRWAALGLILIWGVVLGGFVASNPFTAATPIFGLSIVAAAWVYYHLDWRFR